jgi:hypothetical protein
MNKFCPKCGVVRVDPEDAYHDECGTRFKELVSTANCATCNCSLFDKPFCWHCGQAASDRKFRLWRWLKRIV